MRISGNQLFHLFVCLFVWWNATCEYLVTNSLFGLSVWWSATWEYQINSFVCLFVCLSVWWNATCKYQETILFVWWNTAQEYEVVNSFVCFFFVCLFGGMLQMNIK